MGVRTTRRVLLRGGAGASLVALAACSGDEQSGGVAGAVGRTQHDGRYDRRAATPTPTPTETLTPAPTKSAAPDPQVAGEVITGLAVPWGIAFLPDGTALVGERDTGRLLRVSDGSADPVGTLEVTVPTRRGRRDRTARPGAAPRLLEPTGSSTPTSPPTTTTASSG